MCMIDGDDRAELWNESSQKARKQHQCDECGRAIQPGETYHKVFGIQDGHVFTGKWCAHCEVAKKWLWQNCGGSILSGIRKDIQEHVESYRRSDLARVAVGMKRRWAAFRRGGLMRIPALPGPIQPGDAH